VLRAIDACEALCRPMTDAFALVRHLIVDKRTSGDDDFAKGRRATLIAEHLRIGARRVLR
jgi:hypothetical protein